MKLDNIKTCHVCKGSNLKTISHVQMDDLLENAMIYRDIILCLDCDTIHYINEGIIEYEFSLKIGEKIKKEVKKFSHNEI